MCLARVSSFSLLLSFVPSRVQRNHIGRRLQRCRIRIQRWHLAGLLGHPCHPRVPGSGLFPGTGSAASLCFLPEIAQRGDFLPPCLPGAGVSAAIHHQSNREVSGTISEPVVLTLSETVCLFLMKLMEEGKKKKSADNRCIISPPIYWRMHFSFMEAADMQIYSEWSRYSPQWINYCSMLRRKGPG